MGNLLQHSALLLVDLQNDFCAGGALAVPAGDDIIPIANKLQALVPFVIATQDWHPHDHMSFAANHQAKHVGEVVVLDGISQTLWPVHCVQGTSGADFHPALSQAHIKHVVRKGIDKVVDSYSAFFDNAHRRSTGLHDYLQAQGITHLYILGLATDYCVKYSVLDALQLGYQITVIEDACKGVGLNANDIADAMAEMQAAGARFITHNQFIKSLG
jgi:nicotinamidase/pyrazinamidase